MESHNINLVELEALLFDNIGQELLNVSSCQFICFSHAIIHILKIVLIKEEKSNYFNYDWFKT